jgi:hypothetical protein
VVFHPVVNAARVGVRETPAIVIKPATLLMAGVTFAVDMEKEFFA